MQQSYLLSPWHGHIRSLCAQVNGKKLHPARGAFASFMLPLLAWWLAAIVIFGVSFQKVSMLQEPLTSMQVQCVCVRCISAANLTRLRDVLTATSGLHSGCACVECAVAPINLRCCLLSPVCRQPPTSSSTSHVYACWPTSSLFFQSASLRQSEQNSWGSWRQNWRT